MDGWIYDGMEVWMEGWRDGFIDGWMYDGWTDGGMYGLSPAPSSS